MNIHQINNTAFHINGYFLNRPGKTNEENFNRAKKELVFTLKKQIKFSQKITLKQYQFSANKGFK